VLIQAPSHWHLIELRLVAQLGEVFVDLELIFSESIRVWSQSCRQFIDNHAHLRCVLECFLTGILGLASGHKSLVDHTVFLYLDVCFGDHGILDHLAAKLKVFLGCFLGNLEQLFFVVLKVVIQELLLLCLTLLFFKRHTFVDLCSSQTSC